jgi:hypothetical protein
MSERPTPETDAASWVDTNQANALTLASFSRQLERQRDEARELARELRDALDYTLDYILGDSASYLPNTAIERAHLTLTKAKEVLP